MCAHLSRRDGHTGFRVNRRLDLFIDVCVVHAHEFSLDLMIGRARPLHMVHLVLNKLARYHRADSSAHKIYMGADWSAPPWLRLDADELLDVVLDGVHAGLGARLRTGPWRPRGRRSCRSGRTWW